jgi:hypothetical protein
MNYRGFAVIVVMATLAPAAAGAETSQGSFRASTEPSLIGPTVSGGWETSDNEGTLTFEGGHPFPDGRTRFVGTWTSAAVGEQKRPSLTYRFAFNLGNDLGHLRKLRFMVRARKLGASWPTWRSTVLKPRPDSHSLEGDGDYTLILESPSRTQFQWRIRGRMNGPVVITGEVEVRAG